MSANRRILECFADESFSHEDGTLSKPGPAGMSLIANNSGALGKRAKRLADPIGLPLSEQGLRISKH